MTDLASALTSRATPPPESTPIAAGTVIGGRYRVGSVIGEGGMGVVLEAVHLGLESPVALKVIRSDLMHDEEFVLRFVNEARATALLKGEHIARVYDVGRLETGEPYLVMERLEGVGLETFLESEGPLDAATAVGLLLQVCEGLAEAHAVSLVHRDIKPANLFLARRPDGRAIVKILDFGIAKRLADKRLRSLTNPARSLGSPWYMSPEQMMDPSRVDGRTDIWSLGVLLFELLTNQHPFDGEGVPEVCAKVLNADAPSLARLRDDIDPRLEAIVQRCLEKEPGDRFPDINALVNALLEFAPAATSSSSSVWAPRSSRRRKSSRTTLGSLAPFANRARRHPASWSGVFAVVGTAAAAGAVTWALLVPGTIPRVSAFASSAGDRLDRTVLPWDPVLAAGPAEAALTTRDVELSPPVSATLAGGRGSEKTVTTVGAPSSDPPLTPGEIRARTRRYEAWLRANGLKRIGDVTTDVTNPY